MQSSAEKVRALVERVGEVANRVRDEVEADGPLRVDLPELRRWIGRGRERDRLGRAALRVHRDHPARCIAVQPVF